MQSGMISGSTVNYPTANPAVAPKETLAQEHAKRVHIMSDELANLNYRIDSFLSRMTGPVPQSAESGKDQPEPSGALYVAQFGAQRIANQISRLNELVNRLESIA